MEPMATLSGTASDEGLRAFQSKASDNEPFFRQGQVVLDTNVLLSLYEVSPSTRNHIIDALRSIGDRIWVPYHVALEFNRRRSSILINRRKTVSGLKNGLERAATAASSAVTSAVEAVLKYRGLVVNDLSWEPESHNLASDQIVATVKALMEPLRAELDRFSEHDLKVSDVANPESDPVLAALDQIVGTRVGVPLAPDRLRAVVEEAVGFRYPNEIPPGYGDADKPTSLQMAGDYIVWQQIIEQFREWQGPKYVTFVTGDVKDDWWERDDQGRPLRGRFELRSEFALETGLELLLVTTKSFLEGSNLYLGQGVTPQALTEVQSVLDEVTADDDVDPRARAFGGDPFRLFWPIVQAFVDGGYGMERIVGHQQSHAPLFLVTDHDDNVVLLSFYESAGRIRESAKLRSTVAAMIIHGIEFGLFVPRAGGATAAVHDYAAQHGVRIMARRHLLAFARSGQSFDRLQNISVRDLESFGYRHVEEESESLGAAEEVEDFLTADRGPTQGH